MAENTNDSQVVETEEELTNYTTETGTTAALTYRADKNNDNNKNFFIWIKLRINSKYNSRQA